MTKSTPNKKPAPLLAELVCDWFDETMRLHPDASPLLIANRIALLAYKAGADQLFEACCEFLESHGWHTAAQDMRAARRPKPPSLKRLALEAMQEMRIEPCIIDGVNVNAALQAKYDTIILALEQLND